MPLTPLQHMRREYVKLLALHPDDYFMVDYIVASAVAFQLGRQQEFVWSFIVAPPSSAKTESCNPLKGLPWTIKVDCTTGRSWISGYESDKTNDKGDPVDYSILQEIDGKVILMLDFTTMMTQHENTAKEVMGFLRRAYDGDDYTKGFGTRGLITHKTRFGIVACATPEIDHFLAKEASVGERFLKLRAHRTVRNWKERRAHMDHVALSQTHKSIWRQALADVVSRYLKHYNQRKGGLVHPVIPKPIWERFRMVVDLVARARMTPDGDRLRAPEGPARLQQQLTNLVWARTTLNLRKTWAEDDLAFAARVAYDTLPVEISQLLHTLFKAGRSGLTAQEIGSRTGLSCEGSRSFVPVSLRQLGYVDIVTRPSGNRWAMTPESLDLYGSSGLVEAHPNGTIHRAPTHGRLPKIRKDRNG